MSSEKPLAWFHGEVKSPPFSREARIEAGFLLRRLQNGETLTMPASRPMPMIGANCHELRIDDGDVSWRILYHVDLDAVVILDVFQKKSRTTPKQTMKTAWKRLRAYQRVTRGDLT